MSLKFIFMWGQMSKYFWLYYVNKWRRSAQFIMESALWCNLIQFRFICMALEQLPQGALFCKVRKDSILTERQPQQSNNSFANSWKEKVPTSNHGNLLATKAVTGNHSQPVRGYVSLATRSCHIPYGQQLSSIFAERPVRKPHICNQKSRPLLAVKQNAG